MSLKPAVKRNSRAQPVAIASRPPRSRWRDLALGRLLAQLDVTLTAGAQPGVDATDRAHLTPVVNVVQLTVANPLPGTQLKETSAWKNATGENELVLAKSLLNEQRLRLSRPHDRVVFVVVPTFTLGRRRTKAEEVLVDWLHLRAKALLHFLGETDQVAANAKSAWPWRRWSSCDRCSCSDDPRACHVGCVEIYLVGKYENKARCTRCRTKGEVATPRLRPP